jgi:uncharacterized cupin superfamily protein
MKIKIEQPEPKELESRKVTGWPIWEKEISEFDWSYASTEECYLIEGKVSVTTDDGEEVTFGKGDFVTFPKGLKCVWKVIEPVRKHYNFKE